VTIDEKCENLLIRYLYPGQLIYPSEIHELSRGLLDAYRKQIEKSPYASEQSFFKFMSDIIEKYYTYVAEQVSKQNITIKEHQNILSWWKELLAVPSIQGVLVATQYAYAAPILKLSIVTGYFVKEKWNKKALRQVMDALGTEIIESPTLRNFSEKASTYEAKLYRKAVESSEPEVDELAIILEEARRKIYFTIIWRVTDEDVNITR
jgi:hypothetical protein